MGVVVAELEDDDEVAEEAEEDVEVDGTPAVVYTVPAAILVVVPRGHVPLASGKPQHHPISAKPSEDHVEGMTAAPAVGVAGKRC